MSSQDKEQQPLDSSQQNVINASGGMFEDHGQDDLDYTPDANLDSAQRPQDQSHFDVDDNGEAAMGANQQNLGSEYGAESSHVDETENGQQQMSQIGANDEEELKMKIVLYYHTLVSKSYSVISHCALLVPRNPVPVVRADAATELQKAEQAPIHRLERENPEEFDLGLRRELGARVG